MPLPCWGDTADDLTVWRRRLSASYATESSNPRLESQTEQTPRLGLLLTHLCPTLDRSRGAPAPLAAGHHPVLCCDTCGKRGGLPPPAPGGAHTGVLRRCTYCRVACYCSEACAAAGRETHDHQHQLRMIGFARPLDFNSNDYSACC